MRKTLQRQFRDRAGDVMLLVPPQTEDGGGGFGGDPVEHACKGWVGKFDTTSDEQAGKTNLRRWVVILADTLDVEPTADCTVRVEGKAYSILGVAQDGARAVWKLRVEP